MKLQKHLSRKNGEKSYYKYVVVIPSKLIKELGWEDQQNIFIGVKRRKLIISSKKTNEEEYY